MEAPGSRPGPFRICARQGKAALSGLSMIRDPSSCERRAVCTGRLCGARFSATDGSFDRSFIF